MQHPCATLICIYRAPNRRPRVPSHPSHLSLWPDGFSALLRAGWSVAGPETSHLEFSLTHKQPRAAHLRALTALSLVCVPADPYLLPRGSQRSQAAREPAPQQRSPASLEPAYLMSPPVHFTRLLMYGFLCSLLQKHHETDTTLGHVIRSYPSLCSWSRGSTLPSLGLLRLLHVCCAHMYNQEQTHIHKISK